MSIYRAYDIRGIYGTEITDETAYLIGRAFATYIGGEGEIAVGYDCRPHSPTVVKNLVEGLNDSGVHVVDVGLVPTPTLYYKVYSSDMDGGIMVTASHNPTEFNGFKMMRGKSTLVGDEIQEIRKIVESGKFTQGAGESRCEDLDREYLEYITSHVKLKRPLKVVVDAGNGTASDAAPKALRMLGCEVIELYCEMDGTFPNHHPDPMVDENMRDLMEKVVEEEADCGLGFDGDSDRAGFIDDTGRLIRGDTALMLFSRDVLSMNPGAKIIFDVKCSNLLIGDIKEHGGEPIMSRTGHSFIKKRMIEEDSLLAGEMSGHYFFRDRYFGFDDAIYAALRMVQYLSSIDENMSDVIDGLPSMHSTPELGLACPDDIKFDIVEEVVEHFRKNPGDAEIIDVDGVRLQYSDGWSLLRSSNTSPKLVLRFEAQSPERLSEIKSILLSKLKEYPQLEEGIKDLQE